MFATNLAQFAKDEGLDGIDMDWEYPGVNTAAEHLPFQQPLTTNFNFQQAPDILVDGKPIGQKGDGLGYFKFLTILRDKMDADKTVSIAAPASYWYLKVFPIDRIARVVDYIVYMAYDLHGQWDYGNVNACDSCPSGKCIRSHSMSTL